MEGQILMIIERGFLNHFKTRRLVRELDGDRSAPLYLVRIWAVCEERRSGVLNVTPDELAAICEFDGNPAKLEKTLENCRWVRRAGKRILALGWDERNKGLLASITNGKKGGRPRKDTSGHQSLTTTPEGNPAGTHGKPKETHGFSQANPTEPKPNLPKPVELSGVKLSGEEDPPTVPQGGPERLRIEVDRICQLFGRKRKRLGNEAEHALAELSPIGEDEWRLIEWFYRLPADDAVTEIRVRRHDADTLVLHWSQEVERAERYRKKIGGGANGRSSRPEPEGWAEWLEKKFRAPGDTEFRVPASFHNLSPDVQREFYDEHPKKKEGEA